VPTPFTRDYTAAGRTLREQARTGDASPREDRHWVRFLHKSG
jgi:hypothetical protein